MTLDIKIELLLLLALLLACAVGMMVPAEDASDRRVAFVTVSISLVVIDFLTILVTLIIRA